MTRVLLTGAGGFVGSHVLGALADQTEWELVAIDSFRHNGHPDALYGVAPGNTLVLPHDLVVPFSPRQLEQIGKLDYIVHVASRCSVPESIEHPADFVRNNIDSTLTILELARQQWCYDGRDIKLFDHRLVHLSTDEVYGPNRAQSYTDHRPSSPYAASKAAQEDLVHAWNRTYGIPSTIVNSANMFGERQSMLAYIPRLVQAVLRGQQMPIHAWHGQPGKRRYAYVRNTAQAIVGHLSSDAAGRETSLLRVPLPGQHEVDNLQLALRVASLVGRPLRYELIDGSIARSGYDPSYMSLGGGSEWAQIPFDEGLERTVRWYVDNPGWLQ